MLIRGIYGVVYSTIIIGMFRYIIIIIYEVPTIWYAVPSAASRLKSTFVEEGYPFDLNIKKNQPVRD